MAKRNNLFPGRLPFISPENAWCKLRNRKRKENQNG